MRRQIYVHHLNHHNSPCPTFYLLQAQYGYMVVQTLMNHLDESSKEYAKTKASIVGVLSETVLISAGGSIGLLPLFFIYKNYFN